MKKLLFIVFAVAGITNLATAQQAKVSPTMDPLPTKAESAKATQTKSAASGMTTAPVASTKQAKPATNNTAAYKKAGLTDTEISGINQSMVELDKKKAEIENNSKLTPEQKKNGVEAVQAERNAVLRKSMGDVKYKTFTIQQAQSQGKAKPAKAVKG
ncbi:MAG: hypothetical protein ABI402_15840 [Ferruginibacter sp.]